MAETIIREDFGVQMDMRPNYICFKDMEELEDDRNSYYVALSKVQKLIVNSGLPFEDAAILLGKIQQIFIETLKFNEPDRDKKTKNERKISRIPDKLLISTLCNLLEAISFEGLYFRIKDMKYYEIQDLCHASDPISFLETQ